MRRTLLFSTRALLLVLALLPLVPTWADETKPAGAPNAITTQDQLDEWMMHYYEHPQPELTCSAIQFMSAKGLISESSSPPIAAFLARLVEQDPEKAQEWRVRLGSGGNSAATTIALALWMANNRSELEAMLTAKLDPQVHGTVTELLQNTPPNLLQDEIRDSAYLDMFWGSFFATGDEKYVLRVIDALRFLAEKKDVQKMLIGGAAQWSLVSNAAQHRKVMQICEDQQKTAPSKILADVIKNARKQAKH